MTQADQQQRLGDLLGSKYQILCHIGGGGMANVYLARHRFHGGLFAIKVLAEYLAGDPSIVSRFEHEAQMAASLGSHPNIVSIFDISNGNGLHYLVMQFIAGEDLANYLRREGRVSLGAAANIITQAAEALSCAESHHIVHRDLKPANMLLDEAGRIKLLDFGIARIADASNGFTRPGESIGTPYYMSPEQVRGEPCDIRSDLYSLGVVFFELLTGRRPFDNESATAVQIAHLTTPPPSMLEYDRNLPEPCDAIIQKLLAKRPEDRYQSTSEFLQVLASYGATSGPSTLRPSIDPGLQEAIRRAQELPLDRQPASTTPSAALPEVQASTVSIESVPEVPAAAVVETPVVTKSGKKSPSPPWGMIAGAVLLLLALGWGVTVWLRHPKPVSAPAATTPTLAPVYSDAHGRMVLVPSGDFEFGSIADHTANNMNLPAFYIDETEVSNAEYRRFCEATGHKPPQNPDYTSHPDHPVGGISFEDASAYALWAGKRLPTEEEWEKAARGTDNRLYPWGDAAWTDNVPTSMQPVDSNPLRRSPYGAYNMAGNVWEWTASTIHPSIEELNAMRQLLKGQSFSDEWRIIKGGSFKTGDSAFFAVDKRRALPVNASSPWIGFRCVRNAPPG